LTARWERRELEPRHGIAKFRAVRNISRLGRLHNT